MAALEDACRRGSSGRRRDRSGIRRRAPPRRRATPTSHCGSAFSATSDTTTCTSSSGVAPEHHDQGGHPRLCADHHGNLAKHLATGAGADDIEAIEVGFIAQFTATSRSTSSTSDSTAREPQEPLVVVEVAAGRLRRTEPRSASAPTSAAWLSATGRTCSSRPACPRRRRRSRRCGRRGRSTSPRASATRSTRRRARKFFDSASNVFNAMIGQADPGLLLGHRQGDREQQPEGQGRVGHRDARRSSQGRERGLAAFSTDWNAGFKNGTFATVDVPRLDDGLHPGPGAGHVRQVEHRGRPWRRRQLGRLVPDHHQAVAAPEGGGRARSSS